VAHFMIRDGLRKTTKSADRYEPAFDILKQGQMLDTPTNPTTLILYSISKRNFVMAVYPTARRPKPGRTRSISIKLGVADNSVGTF
jgi:hypothetical protein